MKDIVIIANFVSGLQGTDNDRIPYLANMLSMENSVELVASTFCHEDKVRRTSVFKYPFKITLLDEPGYKKNVCLKRFLSHYIWGRNVLNYIKKRKKPDVIYCTVPSLTAPAKISEYCKQNGIRFIIDVQDLWPEAFQMVFNIPVLSKLLFYPFLRIANKIYRNADEVIAVSQTYVDRALSVNEKGARGCSVYLGTNLEIFDNNAQRNYVSRSDDSEIKLAYCGTLGSSYDLTSVLDALYIVKKNGIANIKFIVMGDGPRRKEFEDYALKLKLDVDFLGKIAYEKMCGILKSCDIAINPITHMAAQSIINKHADYAAAGIPVISTQESTEYRSLVDTYRMGFNCKNGDAQEIAQAIEYLSSADNLRVEFGQNARRCAEEKFNRETTYPALNHIIAGI